MVGLGCGLGFAAMGWACDYLAGSVARWWGAMGRS